MRRVTSRRSLVSRHERAHREATAPSPPSSSTGRRRATRSTGPTAAALADAFRAFDADDDASVAVLYGAGGTFCAGADLKAMDNRIEDDGDGPMGPTRMRLSKPVIAAIEGYAVAGGLELAAWCDLRVAAEDAVLGVFCRRWGVPLIDGGTVRLPRLIGASRAMDLILTGRPVAGGRGASGSAWSTGSSRPAPPARRPRRWPSSWRGSPSSACATTARRCSSRRGSARPTRCGASSRWAWTRSRQVRWTAPPASPPARAGTAASSAAGRWGSRQTATRVVGCRRCTTDQPCRRTRPDARPAGCGRSRTRGMT